MLWNEFPIQTADAAWVLKIYRNPLWALLRPHAYPYLTTRQYVVTAALLHRYAHKNICRSINQGYTCANLHNKRATYQRWCARRKRLRKDAQLLSDVICTSSLPIAPEQRGNWQHNNDSHQRRDDHKPKFLIFPPCFVAHSPYTSQSAVTPISHPEITTTKEITHVLTELSFL